MGLLNFLFKPQQREYSDSVKGRWADTAWSDKKHIAITDKYFPQLDKIEEQWSIMYNLKDYGGKRGENFVKLCSENIVLYKQMATIENSYGEDSPPNAPAFKRLAMFYEKHGRYEEAVAVCTDALLYGAHAENMRGRLLRMIKKSGRTPTDQEMALINQFDQS